MLSKTNSPSRLKITHLRNIVDDIEKQLKIAKDLLRELEEPTEIAKSVTIVDLCHEETQPSLIDSPQKKQKLTRKQRRQQGRIYGRAWYLEEKARQLKVQL